MVTWLTQFGLDTCLLDWLLCLWGAWSWKENCIFFKPNVCKGERNQEREVLPQRKEGGVLGRQNNSIHANNFYWFKGEVIILEKTLESPLDRKEIKPVDPKGNQPWIFFGRIDAETKAPILLASWCEEPTHWKRPWCWERLREGGEGDNRGWDGWMALPTQWTWVWANSGRWWRTGRPGVLQLMGWQRVIHDWVTEQQE